MNPLYAMDIDRLYYILQENNVQISRDEHICLDDFVENVIKSKDPMKYIKRLDCEKMKIHRKWYVTCDELVNILIKSNKGICKAIYEEIKYPDNHRFTLLRYIQKYLDLTDIEYETRYCVEGPGMEHYCVDFYLPDYGIAIDIYDNDDNNQWKKQVRKEKYIRSMLDCEIVRITTGELLNIYAELGILTKKLMATQRQIFKRKLTQCIDKLKA